MRNFIYSSLLILPTLVYAADPLNGTTWKTIDDQSNKARAIVKFSEDKNGHLTATIQKVLVPNEGQKCSACQGKYHNKPLVGVTIVRNLKKVKDNEYGDGKILDPQTGKTYDFNAKLSPDGRKLSGRGYIGVSLVGRNQTWHRIN